MIGTASQSPQDQITAYLRAQGFTAPQIAGIEGNLQTESGFRSTASNPREGAIGIAQWEGGRRVNLQAFARSKGTVETDLQTQLQFMMSELQGSEHSALSALTAQTTAAGAATAFDQKYERSSAASLPTRVANANAIFASGLQGGSGNVAAGSGAQDMTGGATSAGFWSPLSPLNLTSIPGNFLSDVGKWIIDAFLILTGVALVIAGLVILTRKDDDGNGPETITLEEPSSGGSSSSSSHESESTTTNTTNVTEAPANRSRSNGSAGSKSAKGKAAGAAEDAAVAA